MRGKELSIIAGVSGSGKSTALSALEDLGFFCIDNLPAPILADLVRFLTANEPQGEEKGRYALLLDCQDHESVELVLRAKTELERGGVKVHILYFDSSDEVLQKRFREVRRPHPLLVKRHSAGSTLADAIREEREILSGLRENATFLIDSSNFSVHDLRHLITDYVAGRPDLSIVVESFGFKYGLPTNADLVLDVRFLPNPHFIPELRPKTGQDPEVRDYVLHTPEAEEFLSRTDALLDFLIPNYKKEGKRYLTVAIGCTGGKHRSVAISEKISAHFLERGEKVTTRHRDITRE